MDPDLLGVGSTAAAAVLIIVADLNIAIGITARAAPIIALMRASRFEASIGRIDGIAAVLAIQILPDTRADNAAEDRPDRGSRAALWPA
jgi:hypothetical protein